MPEATITAAKPILLPHDEIRLIFEAIEMHNGHWEKGTAKDMPYKHTSTNTISSRKVSCISIATNAIA